MVKKVFIIVFLLCLVVNCMSCGNNPKPYESVLVDFTNDGIVSSAEQEIWDCAYFTNNSAPQTRSIEMLGNQYTGTYNNSITNLVEGFTQDNYYDENYIEFAVNSKTGEVVYLNLTNKDFFDTEPYLDDIDNPYENALAMAKEIAQEFIDISEYEFIESEPRVTYKEKDGKKYSITYYEMSFVKKINGLWTTDRLSLKITSKGHLCSISKRNIGVLDEYADVEIDMDAVLTSVNERRDKIYESYTILESSITNQKLGVTKDDELVLYTALEIKLSDGVNEYNTGAGMITYIVP